jgi:hypothetical protein
MDEIFWGIAVTNKISFRLISRCKILLNWIIGVVFSLDSEGGGGQQIVDGDLQKCVNFVMSVKIRDLQTRNWGLKGSVLAFINLKIETEIRSVPVRMKKLEWKNCCKKEAPFQVRKKAIMTLRIIFTSSSFSVLPHIMKHAKKRFSTFFELLKIIVCEAKARTIKSNILYKFTVQMAAFRNRNFNFFRDLLWIKNFK